MSTPLAAKISANLDLLAASVYLYLLAGAAPKDDNPLVAVDLVWPSMIFGVNGYMRLPLSKDNSGTPSIRLFWNVTLPCIAILS